MSAPLPSNVGVCGVKGHFAYARLASGDADGIMDLVPVVGLVVTLTPAPSFILAPTATTPTVIVPEPLVLTTDSNGDLRDVDNNATAYVIGSDDPDINPHGWTYTVAFSGTSASRFTTYSAVFPAGSTVDLSALTPVPSSLGEGAGTAQAAAAAAAASASAAAASATAAAASAAVAAGTAVVILGAGEALPDPIQDGVLYLRIVSDDTAAPSVPTGLASSAISNSGFTVSWSAATDNTAVTAYQVRIGTGTPVNKTTTSHAFTGLSSGTTYSVTVRAGDAAGNWSAWSSALSVTTSGTGDTTVPSVPTGLASSSITSSGFTVSWSASTDDVAVTGYEVFIGGVSYATPTGTSQVVTGRAASTAYSVTVRARDAAGNWSAQSSALSVTTSAGASALFSDTFDRADGAVGNGWTFPSGGSGNVSSNALAMSGWSGYARAYQGSLPRNVSARAVFTGTIGTYQGIFIAHSSGNGIKLFNNGGTWVIGNSSDFASDNTTVAFTGTPSTPYTTLRLDFDGTTVTAYINGTLVHSATQAALGLSLDSSGSSIYQAGYCGEPKTPNLDSFEVYAA